MTCTCTNIDPCATRMCPGKLLYRLTRGSLLLEGLELLLKSTVASRVVYDNL